MSFELQPYSIEVPLWTKTSKCAHPPPDRSFFPVGRGVFITNPRDRSPLQFSDILFVRRLPGDDYMWRNFRVLSADHPRERVVAKPSSLALGISVSRSDSQRRGETQSQIKAIIHLKDEFLNFKRASCSPLNIRKHSDVIPAILVGIHNSADLQHIHHNI